MSMERTVFIGMKTPWGKAHDADQLCPGIGNVGTPSHGGIKVCASMNKRIPPILRTKGGWYEEDCAWCVPFIVFQRTLETLCGDSWVRSIIEKDRHFETFDRWYDHVGQKQAVEVYRG